MEIKKALDLNNYLTKKSRFSVMYTTPDKNNLSIVSIMQNVANGALYRELDRITLLVEDMTSKCMCDEDCLISITEPQLKFSKSYNVRNGKIKDFDSALADYMEEYIPKKNYE